MFSFFVMIFGVDIAFYAFISWAMKKSANMGHIDKRLCCSFFNFFVVWPLGKWKFMELEIELSKMKDFDIQLYLANQARV